ncbi:MAG: DEAD/DEAH box helicase, partial [Planctomycetota bacterium]
ALRGLDLGGCLADDMGLGKTVQVLAMLEVRRHEAMERQERGEGGEEAEHRPSLVVAPKSLVFNWRQEANRFAPHLRVLEYTGLGRRQFRGEFDQYDLLITTYGTLRRDAVVLKDAFFDYVILDEAQAIKNPKSQAAKAAKLLLGRHRLALTGTPIENHLGDLWSLFDFLVPGMLGKLRGYEKLVKATRTSGDESGENEALMRLSRALRPFFLRRTKDEVLDDLPSKSEQTIHCELSKEERAEYATLRDHFRTELLGRAEEEGMGNLKIHVLEALLRLRQAACHPGLMDKTRADESSSKVQTLIDMLDERLESESKVLVFSQFTSLLSIVRAKLDERDVSYAYLDGSTRKREEVVERFQTDEDCRVFLISLKAGGHGLNLTAADYVFILDPWWNPAAEAQAIDRAHRIGQTRPVFAYRFIAKDTVEEKIAELQESKRRLADALLGDGRWNLRDLSREDLEHLLT